MSSAGAASRAAVSVSNARAAASRQNGAKSRGPRTAEGKTRSSQNALKHGMRAEKHVVLPAEDGAEFAALQAALVTELAPVGALQAVLARRVAVAEFAELQAALVTELAPVGALQTVLARRSPSPPGASPGPIGWPPERGWGPVPHPGGQQVELFAERAYGAAGPGLALIRGPRV